MKTTLGILIFALVACGAFGEEINIQDQIQQASQQYVVLKATSTGLSVVGSGLVIFGLWELSNQAVTGANSTANLLYPNTGNFTLGTGLAGAGVVTWIVASALSFWGDLELAQTIQLLQPLQSPTAKP